MRSGVRPKKKRHSLFSVSGFWRLKMVWHFLFSGQWSIMQVILSTGAYLLLLTPRHWWPKILVCCRLYVFRERYNISQKAVRALITFSQTPQLEGLAALAPRTAYPAPGPAFYRRRSNVLCHRKSLCLSVFCLSSVTSLHPLSALLFIVIIRVNEWWRQCRCRWQH